MIIGEYVIKVDKLQKAECLKEEMETCSFSASPCFVQEIYLYFLNSPLML